MSDDKPVQSDHSAKVKSFEEQLREFAASEDEIDRDLDDAFNALFITDEDVETAGDSVSDEFSLMPDIFSEDLHRATIGEAHALFEHMLIEQLPQVRSFINTIHRGDFNAQTLAGFSGLIEPLIGATQQLGLPDLNEALADLQQLIEDIEDVPHPVPYKLIRPFSLTFEQLIEALSDEVRQEYFADFHYRKDSNELIEEIRRIRNIGPKRIQRLYAAGLTNIKIIEQASAWDIAVTTGIMIELARQIKHVAEEYKHMLVKRRIERVNNGTRDLLEVLQELTYESNMQVLRDAFPALKELELAMNKALPGLYQRIQRDAARRKSPA
jgi:hypothetical protein